MRRDLGQHMPVRLRIARAHSPWRHPEQIKIARSEDQDVEELGQKGDAFGGAVVVDGVDEDALRRRMREVAEDAEDVHVERHRCCPPGACPVASECVVRRSLSMLARSIVHIRGAVCCDASKRQETA